MKHGWTKSLRLASALAIALLAAPFLNHAGAQSALPRPGNELTLAGLRPGKSTLAEAEKRFGTKYRDTPESAGDIQLWSDPCSGQSLRAEVDEQGVIQSVTVSSLGARSKDCAPKAAKNPLPRGTLLTTGRKLALGQKKERVLELYGDPGSELPASYQGAEYELLFYAFDWAGPGVPQVMEVTCERGSGRVRKITLAFPSL